MSDCWYATAEHRPRFAFCPDACTPGVVAGEHMVDGSDHRYCDGHAVWRHHDSPRSLIHPVRDAQAVPASIAS